MSLTIIKAGILDSIQDTGRFGYRHLGINPSGASDVFSCQLANALLGKNLNSPVIEMHFPAAQLQFNKATVLCITGADFAPCINDIPVPINQPFIVPASAVLIFKKPVSGSCCYVSTLPNMDLKKWLNSYSTNLKAAAGGWNGRKLKKGDEVAFSASVDKYEIKTGVVRSLPWYSSLEKNISSDIMVIKGSEWCWLPNEMKQKFLYTSFSISNLSDRMGYRLYGERLEVETGEHLVSTAVSFGTIQLLPNGQLIVLMADHQTTGGYPRIAHVISAHLPYLAQKNPGDTIRFPLAEIETAERKLLQQINYLQQIQKTCKLKIQKYLHADL
ncbi:MAG TPA: biotin-dependent carboxyltransferase family protein [Flavisolibacter sp.]|nr:biotin-dependent carboxyltransferase family protein [Flavisolibacter sp.]